MKTDKYDKLCEPPVDLFLAILFNLYMQIKVSLCKEADLDCLKYAAFSNRVSEFETNFFCIRILIVRGIIEKAYSDIISWKFYKMWFFRGKFTPLLYLFSCLIQL